MKGSTDEHGRKGLPVLCQARECTGRHETARHFDCYIPITESLMCPPPDSARDQA